MAKWRVKTIGIKMFDRYRKTGEYFDSNRQDEENNKRDQKPFLISFVFEHTYKKAN